MHLTGAAHRKYCLRMYDASIMLDTFLCPLFNKLCQPISLCTFKTAFYEQFHG